MKNSSAINSYNVAVTDQSGKVGTVRYYQKGGRTYVRSASNRNDKNSNPRTDKQMKSRLHMTALMVIFQLLGNALEKAFQYKKRWQNTWNAFVQANAYTQVGYVTKEERRKGLFVPAPYVMSEGELPPISLAYSEDDGAYISNLALGGTTEAPTDISSVAKLSKAIVDNNPDFHYGEQITFLAPWQISPEEGSGLDIAKVVLDPNDESATPAALSNVEGFLAFSCAHGNDMACCIHSNEDGQMSDSTAVLNTAAQALYEQRTTDAAFQTARDSYGKSEDVLLVP